MSSHSLRQSSRAAARCARQLRRPNAAINPARCISQAAGDRPPMTQEQWQDLQAERSNFKLLSTTRLNCLAEYFANISLNNCSGQTFAVWVDSDSRKHLPAASYSPQTPRTQPINSVCSDGRWCTPRSLKISHEPQLHSLRLRYSSRNHGY